MGSNSSGPSISDQYNNVQRKKFLSEINPLLDEIKKDDVISTRTKDELLFAIEGLPEWQRKLLGDTGYDQSVFPEDKPTPGSSNLEGIKKMFEEAQASKGKYKSRQSAEDNRALLSDRPGQRQLLLTNNQRTRPAAPVLTGPDASEPPVLTRKGRR